MTCYYLFISRTIYEVINVKVSYSFINFCKFFSIHFELLIKVLDVSSCIDAIRVLIDWSNQRLDNLKALSDIFFVRNLITFTPDMQSSESSTAQNFVVVAAEEFSWLVAWVVFSIKSKQLRLAQPFFLIKYWNEVYLQGIGSEFLTSSILNKNYKFDWIQCFNTISILQSWQIFSITTKYDLK